MDGDTWQKWVDRFWFLRGVAAAILFAQLLPSFISLSQFEVLQAFHAIVVGWGNVAARIGASLRFLLPILPRLTATEVNATLFASAVGVPIAYAFVTRAVSMVGPTGWFFRVFLGLFAISVVLGSYTSYLLIAGRSVSFTHDEFVAISHDSEWANAAMIVMMFLITLFTLRGYAKGLFVVLSFIATMQVLYFLQTPWLADVIKNIAASAASP